MACETDESETKHFIECNVCYEQFDHNERQPKLIPCFHTICLSCLKNIANGGPSHCPICRTPFSMDTLHTNQAVLHIIKLNDCARCHQLNVLAKGLKVENCLQELIENHSPKEEQFFKHLDCIMSFVVKDETRPLEPVWRIQSNLKDDKIRFEFHNCILEFAPQLAATHIDYLINDLKSRLSLSDNTRECTVYLTFTAELVVKLNDEVITAQVLDYIGDMAWRLEISVELEHCCIDTMIKILNNCWRGSLIRDWILKCIYSIQQRQRASVGMRLIRQICYLFAAKAAATNDHHQSTTEFKELVLLKYKDIYDVLDKEWRLFDEVVAELVDYFDTVYSTVWQESIRRDGDDYHKIQVEVRVGFLSALAKYGCKILDIKAVETIWNCLVRKGIMESDWNSCFTWFTRVQMTPESNRCMFYEHILALNPHQINESAMNCFEHFFRAVAYQEGDTILHDADSASGIEFLKNVFQHAEEAPVKQKAYELLRETADYLGLDLIHASFSNSHTDVENCADKDMDEDTESTHWNELMEHDSQSSNQEHTQLSVASRPLSSRFDTQTSMFLLNVTKNDRLFGQIYIKLVGNAVVKKFGQELGDFCFRNERKIGRQITKANNTYVRLKIKNAKFRPIVPELRSNRTWLDSERLQEACQVGITGIQTSRDGRVIGWELVFLLRDTMTPQQSKSGRVKPSLLFGEVDRGMDVIKLLGSRPQVSLIGNQGLHFSLVAFNP